MKSTIINLKWDTVNKSNLFSFILVMLFCLFSSGISAQSTSEVSEKWYDGYISSEKFGVSLGGGIKSNYGGPIARYFINEKLAFKLSFSLSQLRDTYLSPMVGVEYNLMNVIKSNRIVPYGSISIGVNSFQNVIKETIDTNYIDYPRYSIIDTKLNIGPSFEIGAKFKLYKKIRLYGSIGLRYRTTKEIDYTEYISENELESGIYFIGYSPSRFFPTIAIHHIIKYNR